MHQFANGSSAAVSLLGGESGPPVGPETVGRPPSGYDAPPIPLRPFPTSLAKVPVEILPEAQQDAQQEAHHEDVPVLAEVRRLVVRLLGGDEIELGSFDERDDAMEAAQQLVARFSSAEASGEWPEVDGRFLRPGSVASIDVLVAG
jgi:hypothetical protein